jgi:protein-tyrosine phosphatase
VRQLFNRIKQSLDDTGLLRTASNGSYLPYHPSAVSCSEHYRSPNWVIPKKLAIGSFPTLAIAQELKTNQIQWLLSLCHNLEAQLPIEIQQQFTCVQLPLPDSHYPTLLTPDQIATAVAAIQQAIDNQQAIYVHCLAGIERSPLICMPYLCTHERLELWETLNWMKQVHPRTMPTDAQIRVLRAYLQEIA